MVDTLIPFLVEVICNFTKGGGVLSYTHREQAEDKMKGGQYE